MGRRSATIGGTAGATGHQSAIIAETAGVTAHDREHLGLTGIARVDREVIGADIDPDFAQAGRARTGAPDLPGVPPGHRGVLTEARVAVTIGDGVMTAVAGRKEAQARVRAGVHIGGLFRDRVRQGRVVSAPAEASSRVRRAALVDRGIADSRAGPHETTGEAVRRPKAVQGAPSGSGPELFLTR